jgi:hypothetical protein
MVREPSQKAAFRSCWPARRKLFMDWRFRPARPLVKPSALFCVRHRRLGSALGRGLADKERRLTTCAQRTAQTLHHLELT